MLSFLIFNIFQNFIFLILKFPKKAAIFKNLSFSFLIYSFFATCKIEFVRINYLGFLWCLGVFLMGRIHIMAYMKNKSKRKLSHEKWNVERKNEREKEFAWKKKCRISGHYRHTFCVYICYLILLEFALKNWSKKRNWIKGWR